MSADILHLIARACKPQNANLPRPVRRPEPEVRTYSAILVRDDVTIGELAHALRFSGVVVSTDPASGQVIVHRAPAPGGAA